jgi:hypothetical protein
MFFFLPLFPFWEGDMFLFSGVSDVGSLNLAVRKRVVLPEGELKLKLIYDRQSVGQSALVSGAHLGSATNFFFSLKFPLDSCSFVIL